MRTQNDNERALRSFITQSGGMDIKLKRHSPTVYQWRGLYLEVLTFDQMIRSGVPASWYSPYQTDYGNFRIREMGNQSAKVKKIKEREENAS